jgi:hypothetical protein
MRYSGSPLQDSTMKRLLLLLSLLCLWLGTAQAQGMVSLSMGQPGFYGRIDIGGYQQPPPLLYSDAVMGNPGIYTGPPVYMHVPPAHARAWSRHCHYYGACDWMVYFVDNGWYNNVYVPGFRSGAFAYAPAPVYVAPPIYRPRPYYGHHPHHEHHHDHHVGPPYGGGHDGRHHRKHHHGGNGHHPGEHKHHGGHHGHHGNDRR